MSAVVEMISRDVRDPELAATDLAALVEREGVVELAGVVSPAWLESARSDVGHAMSSGSGNAFLIFDPSAEESPAAEAITTDRRLIELFEGLTRQSWPRAVEPATVRLRSFLRIVVGADDNPPTLLHYDAYVVTMVIPIVLPAPESAPCGRRGELLALGNHRRFRRTVAAHVVDKLRTHNGRYRAQALASGVHDALVPMELGKAYLFWGYRTFHGNLPLQPGLERATLIVHYGLPHRDSRFFDLAKTLSPARRGVRRYSKVSN
ncbi:hypothetical protein FK268_13660 [Tsukamurella sputi]|uniref:Phytanoyl-CoA dioxygenase family protein n=1 Tax=Tsukamurella sputi TaxID=2591848 RepID=A0A5C5RK54_9ACTN|nr:hypothetical protein [Tsukamurella sputi]TWS23337.1 hypothetical protein FK268_13660 [Tsukamurella sputi]